MGQEYRIEWKTVGPAELRAWLERRGGKPVLFDAQEQFEFRFDGMQSESKIADALVVLEQGSIYFCDNARTDKSAAVFRGLIDEALTRAGSGDSVVVRGL